MVSLVLAPVREMSLCCVVTFCASVVDAHSNRDARSRRLKKRMDEGHTSFAALSRCTQFSWGLGGSKILSSAVSLCGCQLEWRSNHLRSKCTYCLLGIHLLFTPEVASWAPEGRKVIACMKKGQLPTC